MPKDIRQLFEKHYLHDRKQTVQDIYDKQFSHCDAHAATAALIEFDELVQNSGGMLELFISFGV